MPFKPRFEITPETAKALMRIESAKIAVENLPVTPQLLASLRQSARLLTTHYSTQIEGNQLTMAEVEKVVIDRQSGLPGRERDESEVRNYYRALEHIEALSESWEPISERDLRVVHGLVMKGRGQPTPYRDGQNVIRDSASNQIVYLPPECCDVPLLMEAFVSWLDESLDELRDPAPVIAAIVHYQFATIHPYYDGNGRTARLLTNLVLHRSGYGLKGIYSLEEYYSQNLGAYYAAISIGTHNYYDGREHADMTPFLSYFVEGMAVAFEKVKGEAERQSLRSTPRDHSHELRELRPRQREALDLFRSFREITSMQLAEALSISARQARELCTRWVADGFLVIENPSKRARSYRLEERWESVLGNSG
jgi:Fic family protein